MNKRKISNNNNNDSEDDNYEFNLLDSLRSKKFKKSRLAH